MERRDDKEDRELKKGKGENKKKRVRFTKKKKREHPQTSSHTAEQKNVALLR